jgi:hypothetical protein
MVYEAAYAYNDAGVDNRRDIESFVTVAEDFHEGTSIFDEYSDQIGAAQSHSHNYEMVAWNCYGHTIERGNSISWLSKGTVNI